MRKFLLNSIIIYMSDIIEKYYIKYKFPNLERLYNYLKNDDISVTKKQVKLFLDNQMNKQITTQKKVLKSNRGHIVAYFKNELWQIDIFFLPKYYKSNKGYKFIFCCIDVFTRFVYCRKMKNKDNEDVIKALKSILKIEQPEKIISDSDSTFLSHDFQAVMKEYNIIHESVAVGDHEALGIIDRFARTLKERLTALFLGSNSTNWINDLDEIVDDYNNTKNRGILKIKPSKASLPENNSLLVEYNKKKSLKNNIVSDLNVGDKVRIYIKGSFDKGTDPTYSNEVYKVEKIRGKTIILSDGKIKKRDNLLLVPPDTISGKTNIIKQISNIHKSNQVLKKLDVQPENIVDGKRNRKKKEILDI